MYKPHKISVLRRSDSVSRIILLIRTVDPDPHSFTPWIRIRIQEGKFFKEKKDPDPQKLTGVDHHLLSASYLHHLDISEDGGGGVGSLWPVPEPILFGPYSGPMCLLPARLFAVEHVWPAKMK